MRQLHEDREEGKCASSSDEDEERPRRRANLPRDRRVATSEETREVRCVAGSGPAGPALWYYIPHMRRDQNRQVRRGWWLHPCDEEELRGLYYIGPLAPVQRNKTTIVEDVGVLADFPFVRTVKLTARGEEIANTIYVRTARPFNDDELAVPRAAMQTAIREVEAQNAPAPPPAPRARRQAGGPEEGWDAQRRSVRRRI